MKLYSTGKRGQSHVAARLASAAVGTRNKHGKGHQPKKLRNRK